MAPILGAEATAETSKGKLLVLDRNGVHHRIFLTRSSQGRKMTVEEQTRMVRLWERRLGEDRPELVISYGSSTLAQALRARARARGVPIAIYLGNAEYKDSAAIHPDDLILTPSHFLKTHYQALFGREVRVVRTIMDADRLLADGEPAIAARPEDRQLGFVTFINPIPHKGLMLFAQLARMAWQARPALTFLVIQGRMSRRTLRHLGADIAAYPNVWWVPTQSDVRPLYRRTAVLLLPSFWQEGFPRSVMESQLNGIPVIASSRGGIPEALNGGGIMLDLPEACQPELTEMPDEAAVRPWLEALIGLWDDEAAYRAATARAREAARPFRPDITAPAAVAFFRDLIAETKADPPAGTGP